MIEPGTLLAAFFALCAGGAGLALLVPDERNPAALAWIGSLAASVVMLASAAVLVSGQSFHIQYWQIPPLGPLTLALDPLSALFLFIAGLVFLPVSIFSGSYLRKYMRHYSLRYFSLLYYALLASIAYVLIAHDVFSFLVAWELMSIASYLLVTYEHDRADSARASFIMLAMSEAGFIPAALALILLANAGGALDFGAIHAASAGLGHGLAWAVFLLSFFGFAVKAGLVPVNSWLPLAQTVAPINVAALLSGALDNLGIYGIARVNLDLSPAPGDVPGLIVLALGSVTALVGILYATIQVDLKRLLAHSTIENMGIIAAGLGAGMVFLASSQPILAGIAFIAAFYHMGNHSLYKTLLFLGTGAVEAGAGSRDLDRLGGIARAMPWTSVLFLIGVLAISALPPLNGFVGEWLTLQSILRAALLSSTAAKVVFAISGAALALTAGLAVTCFVKVYAMGFLGLARSDEARNAKEPGSAMRSAMALLGVCCILLGLLPTYVIPLVDRVVTPITHEAATDALVPPFFTIAAGGAPGFSPAFLAEFHDLGAEVGRGAVPGRGLVVLHQGTAKNPVMFAMSTSYMVPVFAALLALVYVAFRLLTRGRLVLRRAAWDGGIRRLEPGLTYTATGFSNPVRVIFHAILRPATVEDSTDAVAMHFRTAIRRVESEDHIVDRLVLAPVVTGLRRVANVVRRMHLGPVNAYASYVLIMLLVVLALGMATR
jgi:hydrogenase-4 component B